MKKGDVYISERGRKFVVKSARPLVVEIERVKVDRKTGEIVLSRVEREVPARVLPYLLMAYKEQK